MSKKLGLALIVAGAILGIFSEFNLDRAGRYSQRVRQESAMQDKSEIEIARSPKMMRNQFYGGASGALEVVSIGAMVLGTYLTAGKKYFN